MGLKGGGGVEEGHIVVSLRPLTLMSLCRVTNTAGRVRNELQCAA